MEITARRAFDVTIGNKFFITTVFYRSCCSKTEIQLKDWIHMVQKRYGGSGKRNKQDIIVGITAEASIGHRNGLNREKGSQKDAPYDAMVLCVGNHCLIHELSQWVLPPVTMAMKDFLYDSRTVVDAMVLCVGNHCLIHELSQWVQPPVTMAMKDFLYDSRTVVVGAGIEKMAQKLQKDYDLMITRRLELRAEAKKVLPEYKFCKSSLGNLARVVLEGEVDLVPKPRSMSWFSDNRRMRLRRRWLGMQLTMLFLAYQMGLKLLKN